MRGGEGVYIGRGPRGVITCASSHVDFGADDSFVLLFGVCEVVQYLVIREG